jgi:hypothetical protein
MTAVSTQKQDVAAPGDKPTGKTRSFAVTIHATMTLDESVIAQGMADVGYIMKNPTEEEVLSHLAYNLVGNGLMATPLSGIDGYANCPDASARITDKDAEVDFEIKPKVVAAPSPKKSKRRAR